MIESNLSRISDYEWIEKVRKIGYDIVLYFLSTASVDENIARVKRRVSEGGHDVPDHIIRDRYNLGVIYLKSRLYLFKEIFLLDNTGATVLEIAHIANGKLESEIDNSPAWVRDVLFFIKRVRTK